MMMLALASMATSAFAQTAKEEAEKWNDEAKKQLELFSKEQAVMTQNMATPDKAVPFDTVAMYKAGYAALEAILKCDEYDKQPNEKGKVKIKFRAANAPVANNLRIAAIQGGEHFRIAQDYEKAIQGYKLYIDSYTSEIFTGTEFVKSDPYVAQIAYIASILLYQQYKNYDEAIKYAEISKKYETDSAGIASADEVILFSKKDRCKTAEDSLAFINEIKALHKADIANQRYFNLISAYYEDHPEGKKAWLEEEIQINPNNKMVWANKGVMEMNEEKYDEAIESYKKAVEIDPEFVQVLFNIGVCLNSKAVQLNDKLSDKNTGTIKKDDKAKVEAILVQARDYLLKAKELDPEREKVNWAYALGRVYYALGDEANYNAMEALQ